MTTIPGFTQQTIHTTCGAINVATAGQGPPVLLLHGYPQTHYMWHKVAPQLAQEWTVVAPDLRGYGGSCKPRGLSDHANYSKRAMAGDQVEVMQKLGFDRFSVVGHDRGARVAHRMALDAPERVERLVLIDIAPTFDMYRLTDQEFATAYYHWFFLIQPSPFPEQLIQQAPELFLERCLASWSRLPDSFTPEAMQAYTEAFRAPETIHATCEDYRASATIDLVHDRQDRDVKIACPLLVLWGGRGFIEQKYSVLEIWKERATNVAGQSLDCGHFVPEECPEETCELIRGFLS